jgi:demethylmenaquinone methyltransferase/2-methoxy-6-polyprenyl-1,4-benzoquinol methylase
VSGPDPAVEGLVAYYDRRAPDYDRLYDRPERRTDLERLRALVEERSAGEDVLELACGTGYWTAVLAHSARSVLATDLSEASLSIARERELPKERVRFGTANAYYPEQAPGDFTAIFAGVFWSHVPRRHRTLFVRALNRRLTRGARVLLCDNRYVEGSSTPLAARDEHGNTYQDRPLDDGSIQRVIKNFDDRSDIERTFGSVAEGLELIELDYFWLLAYRVGGAPDG